MPSMMHLSGTALVYKNPGGGVTFAVCALRLVWQQYLDVVLGAVLALAGVLKAEQLLTDPLAGRGGGFPRWLLYTVAAFELTFGLWMLGGLYRHVTRWLALLWFTSLAAVSLAQAVNGVPSCACFGKLSRHPALMFAFDVAAVAA
jgi:hypothetical protein